MSLESAIEKFEEYVLKNENSELENIYLNILTEYSKLTASIERLTFEKEKIEQDLEERKELMWNNPVFRNSIISQVWQAARS